MLAPFFLAIDIGTSRTAAAIARWDPDRGLIATSLPLGRASDSAPTVVFAGEAELLFGDAAERRGVSQPARLMREFKRRVGDDVPIVAGDRRLTAEELYALTVGWVIGVATEREGQHPAGIALTVPVSWGDYRSRLVTDALALHGWGEVTLITEPEAAARHYAADHPLTDGHALAVYDLGGGTFDAVVLRSRGGALEVAEGATGISDLGGADFDDAVLRHILSTAALSPDTVTGDTGRMALNALRRECVEAKESLSFDSETAVPVLAGSAPSSVRLTRGEFEDMIQPELERTVACLESAIDSARVVPEDLDAVLLTGGSSRIPRIAQLLSERFDRPVALDADPKAIIALGAARAVATAHLSTPVEDEVDEEDEIRVIEPAAASSSMPRRSWFRRAPSAAFVVAGVVAVTCGLVVGGAGTLARTSADSAIALPSLAEAHALIDRLRTGSGAATSAPSADGAGSAVSEDQGSQPAEPQRRADDSRSGRTAPVTPRTPTASQDTTSRTPSASAPPSSPSRTSSTASGGPSAPAQDAPASTAQTATQTPEPPAPQPTSQPPAPEPTPDPSQPDPAPEPTTEPQPEPTTEPPADPAPAQTEAPPPEQHDHDHDHAESSEPVTPA